MDLFKTKKSHIMDYFGLSLSFSGVTQNPILYNLKIFLSLCLYIQTNTIFLGLLSNKNEPSNILSIII
jgi:hypothetical protein